MPASAKKPPGFTVIGEVSAGEGVAVRMGGRWLDPGHGGWRHG
jgi:thiamine-monophosphate kinase